MGKKDGNNLTITDQMAEADKLWELEQRLFGRSEKADRNNSQQDERQNYRQELRNNSRNQKKKKWDKKHQPVSFSKNEKEPKIRTLQFILNKQLNRMILDDGIVPTPFNVEKFKIMAEIITDINDYVDDSDRSIDDYVSNALSVLMTFIVGCKHPAAILTVDEFVEAFKFVIDVGRSDIYKFFSFDDYVLIHIIDEDSYTAFTEWMDSMNLSPEDQLNFMINLTKMVVNVHNSFDVYEEEYVEKFKKIIDKDKQAVISHILDDTTTILDYDEDEADFDDLMEVCGITDFHEHRDLVMRFIIDATDDEQLGTEEWDGTDDDEDDDEYDTPPVPPFNGGGGTVSVETRTESVTNPQTSAVSVSQTTTETTVTKKLEVQHTQTGERKVVEAEATTVSNLDDKELSEEELAAYIQKYQEAHGRAVASNKPRQQTIPAQNREAIPQKTPAPVITGSTNTASADDSTEIRLPVYRRNG